ncbi:MAG: hypothetical protein JW910_01285 [Anaerolineae bacterium]|nr:hypothetical protein [Anaerolineae bacterium]
MAIRSLRPSRRTVLVWLAVLIPAVLIAVHALRFANWIIDDAGITFAYARNLAEGYGLVAQPGLEPVEGYSNFLWMILFTPFFWLHVFHATLIPKLLSLICITATLAILDRTLARLTPRHAALTFVAGLLLASNASFVIWTTSGLENPLYVLLIAALAWVVITDVIDTQPDRRRALLAGVLLAGIAMTRPDGLVYVGVVFLLPPLKTIGRGRRVNFRRVMNHLYLALGAFLLLYGAFIAFRLAYFHDVFPNTYWAKGGPSLSIVLDFLTLQPEAIGKLRDLFAGLAGPLGDLLMLALVAGTVGLMLRRRWRREHTALLLFLLVGLGVYLLLPDDWMPEYRFATPFFLFVYAYGAVLVEALWARPTDAPVRRTWAIPAVLAALAIAGSVAVYNPRSLRFAAGPTVPLQRVATQVLGRFTQFAEVLGVDEPTVLLPDIGGMLLYGDLPVVDLGGLIDPFIARTLHRGDAAAFRERMFTDVRPAFIHTHGGFTYSARFDDDPRFRELYLPLCEYVDTGILDLTGETMYSGDYVRRDLITPNNWGDFFRFQNYPCE